MKSTWFRWFVPTSLLVAVLASSNEASAKVDPVEIGVRIGKKLGGGVVSGAKSIGGTAAKIFNVSSRHDKVTSIVIDGKRAFLLDLYDDKGNL